MDPIATQAIEDLVGKLTASYTIGIVTDNMQRAAWVPDHTAFFNLAGIGGPGGLIEYADSGTIVSTPEQQSTENYVSGRFS